MIYFTSDLHLSHKNILKFERFKFNTIEEHDNNIYAAIAKLHALDTLYILGDIGSIDPEKWYNANIKCKIYLLKGNHDKAKDYYYERFGITVIENPFYFNDRVYLSHEPARVENDILNLHGHLHGSTLDLPNYFNANYYVNDCKFLSKRDIDNILSSLPKNKNKYKFGYEWWIHNQVILPEYREVKKDQCLEGGYLNVEYIRGFEDE